MGLIVAIFVYCSLKRKKIRNAGRGDFSHTMTISPLYGQFGKTEEKEKPKLEGESVYAEVDGLGMKKDDSNKNRLDGTHDTGL